MTNSPKTFGVNVWWTVPEVIVDGVQAQNALSGHGFSREMIKLPTRKKEISRAAYAFQNRRGKSDRRVTEKTQDSDKYVVWGILNRDRVDAKQVSFKQETTITLNKSDDSVKVSGELWREVRKTIDIYTGQITDEDIRAFLTAVIRKSYGVAKRPSGGIYFIPASKVHLIDEAQAALKELGSGAKLYVERVMDGVEERQNVWGSVEEDIEKRIGETLRAVERIEKRANSVKTHKDKLSELNELVNVYKELLGEEAKHESIAEMLEEAVKTVEGKMSDIQKGTAKKARKVTTKKVEAPEAIVVATPMSPATEDETVSAEQGNLKLAVSA